jgi:hypothetical protein
MAISSNKKFQSNCSMNNPALNGNSKRHEIKPPLSCGRQKKGQFLVCFSAALLATNMIVNMVMHIVLN